MLVGGVVTYTLPVWGRSGWWSRRRRPARARVRANKVNDENTVIMGEEMHHPQARVAIKDM